MTHTHTIACSAGIPGGRLMCGDDALRAAAEAVDAALQAELSTESIAEASWANGKMWAPVEAFRSLPLPCPMRSSLTDEPCSLRWGHPADSPTRFHAFRAALASSRPEPLDVERLATVLHRRYGNQHLPPVLDFDHPLDGCPDRDYWRAEAFAIADAEAFQ